MFRKIVTAALLAGSLAGLCLWLIQQWHVIPLILEAETYEASVATPETLPSADHHVAAGGHTHDDPKGDSAQEWAPEEGLERAFFSAIANVLAGIGFSLLLGAVMSLHVVRSPWQGAIWGLAGYVTFYLAPTLGLPAELPGTEAAPLLARQAWWLLTVTATGGGLWLLAYKRTPLLMGAGVILLAVPHIFGAPHPESHSALAPDELIERFANATLLANLVFWLLLGLLTAVFHRLVELGSPAR